jgi:hypothetical protein
MNPIIKNSLALLAGVISGSLVNMGIIMISGAVIPAPEGADVTTMEGLKTTMHLFQPRHFIFPFAAHALGTFAGAFIAALIAASHQMKFAFGVGIFFLAGGIANTIMLPSPTWFTILDLLAAYLPMAYFGGRIAMKRKTGQETMA